MIKINLIRQKRKKRKKVNYDLVFFLSILIFLVGIFSFHKTVLVSRQHKLERDVRQAQIEIAKLKKQIGEVEKFKQKKKELQKKVDIVANLQKGRRAPVLVMDALVKSVPEKAWVTRLNYKGGFLEVEGYALNNYVVADFMNNIGSTKKFGEITLQSAEKKVIRGVSLMYYKIKCQVNA